MNPVTAAHTHLILCHVPVMAILFGWGWLAFGIRRGSRDIQKAALGMFILAAVLAVPLYLTGQPASGIVKGLPGFSDHLLEQHQAAAGVTLAGCIMLGIVALASLINFRRKPLAGWLSISLLIGALLVCALTVWTSYLGGQIRHSEIRAYSAETD